MSFNRLNGNFLLSLSGLLVFLPYAQVFCAQEKGNSIVHDIYFGYIEPPVVAQKDITVSAPTSNQQTEARPLECSSLAWLDGYLIIASDRHEHLLFTCSVDLNTLEFGPAVHSILIHNEQYLLKDVESMTILQKNESALMYMMCSLSNAPNAQPLPGRRQLLCCNVTRMSPFQADHCNVLSMETLRRQLETCFRTIRAQPYSTYDADLDKNTYRWGNVEGITFTPDEKYLLCGIRNPLYDGAAMVCAVSGMSHSAQSLQQESLKITDLFLLDLQERGISDLTWDPVTQGYLITAAKSNGPRLDPDRPFPPNSLDSALFWWSGYKKDQPVLVARIPDMTIEAVCRLGLSRYIVLGSDEGDVSEGRTARQSVLTVLEFTGIPQ